jgi:hypothetical protein
MGEIDRQPDHTDPAGVWAYQAEALRRAPGVDPVMAVLEGDRSDIPASGYLIAANVRLGSRKVGAQIHCFDRNHLLFSDPRHPDTMFGVGYVTAELKSPYETTAVFGSLVCQFSGYKKPGCYDLTSTRAKIVAVGNEGNYVAITDTHSYNSAYIHVTSYNPLSDGNRGRRTKPVAQLARVVASQEDALAVVRAITEAADLSKEEQLQFERTVAEQLAEVKTRADQREALRRQAVNSNRLGTVVIAGARRLGIKLR